MSGACHLGSHCYSYGFTVRPEFPWQDKAVMKSHLKHNPGTALTSLSALRLSHVVKPQKQLAF